MVALRNTRSSALTPLSFPKSSKDGKQASLQRHNHQLHGLEQVWESPLPGRSQGTCRAVRTSLEKRRMPSPKAAHLVLRRSELTKRYLLGPRGFPPSSKQGKSYSVFVSIFTCFMQHPEPARQSVSGPSSTQ